MKPAARSNGRGGYKAVIVHDNGRTEILGTQHSLTQDGRNTFISKAAPSMDRDAAITFAAKVIAARIAHTETYMAAYNARHSP